MKHIHTFESFLNEGNKHKFSVGDFIVFDGEKARINKVYTARNGTDMYAIGSSKHGTIEIEAEEVDSTNESVINESYSSSDISKLKDFAKKVSDEIVADYEGVRNFDKEEFTPEAMFDYISDWGQTNNMSAKDVMDEFVWSELTDELGLPRN